MDASGLRFEPVTAERWDDLRTLFGDRGAYGGCWCMWWRQTRSDFNDKKGPQNEAAMRAIVEGDEVPGVLAYDGPEPVGWVSVAPREAFPSLQRSRTLKPVDAAPAWAIVCFYVRPSHRNTGLMARLIVAAGDYAASRGATVLEAFPEDIEPGGKLPAAFSGAYMGVVSAFRHAGFTELARRSKRQPIMRKRLG